MQFYFTLYNLFYVGGTRIPKEEKTQLTNLFLLLNFGTLLNDFVKYYLANIDI